jgi:hypothetical protein
MEDGNQGLGRPDHRDKTEVWRWEWRPNSVDASHGGDYSPRILRYRERASAYDPSPNSGKYNHFLAMTLPGWFRRSAAVQGCRFVSNA